MTPALEDLRRRALVMRRVRAALAILVPVEMLLYVPPPSVASALDPGPTSFVVAAALLLVVACSAAVSRRVQDSVALLRWGRLELAADAAIALAVLQVFAFDQFSSIWTVLVIVVLEGAFREGVRGALVTWAAATAVYTGIQVHAAHVYPRTAPLDVGSIVFRALVVGVVAWVAGQLASQLEAAIERHRRSEMALAEQYADLKLIGRVSRAIAAGPEAREDVCAAVAEISGANVVMLFEPAGRVLRGTAVAGCPLEALPVLDLDDGVSGTVEAFDSGTFVHRRIARLPQAVASSADFPASAATSTSFFPVLQDGRSIGVLVLAFDHEMAELSPRVAAALEVLAEEAAVAIARADAAVLLAEQARRDALTGLANRRGWEEALDQALALARRGGTPLAMLMLDLDGLKTFNDTAGHSAGDELLAGVAAVWSSRLRDSDLLARYGGDEFAALLPNCDLPDALRIAGNLLVDLPPGAACSVGVAVWDRVEDAETLLARADAALYDGKRAGGGRAVAAAPHCPMAAVPVPPPRDPAVQPELRRA
jgi:diguanylate cyclase (GGDEF)-like protein